MVFEGRVSLKLKVWGSGCSQSEVLLQLVLAAQWTRMNRKGRVFQQKSVTNVGIRRSDFVFEHMKTIVNSPSDIVFSNTHRQLYSLPAATYNRRWFKTLVHIILTKLQELCQIFFIVLVAFMMIIFWCYSIQLDYSYCNFLFYGKQEHLNLQGKAAKKQTKKKNTRMKLPISLSIPLCICN